MVDILIQTRFSFFGKSGWRSKASADPEKLFNPERLDQRLELFEKIALASLRAQTDPDFRLLILSSNMMPEAYQQKLTELCHRMLGEERVKIMFQKPHHAGTVFRKYVNRTYDPETYLAQVVLDDDDGLSHDFIAICRNECLLAKNTFHDGTGELFLSFPTGYSLMLRKGKPDLIPRSTPFTNLGLTLLSKASSRVNPYSKAHRKLGERFETRVIGTMRPFYLRSVHTSNDSRAMIEGDILTETEIAEILPYFPYLQAFLAQE